MTATAVMEVEEKALSVPDQTKSMTVASNEDYEQGEILLASCKQIENEIHATFDPIVDKANQAHKEAVAQRKKYLDPIEEGRRILKGKMITYQQEQERIRQEEQRQAEEESKRRSEEEALAAAVQAEQEGDTETAEAILAEPVRAAPVIIPKTAPAPSRLSAGRTMWYAEVTDLKALCKAIVDGKAPITYIQANMTALNSRAKSDKNLLSIPGVQAKNKMI